MLLFHNSTAVGFATVNYRVDMNILDTVFVSRNHRKKRYATQLLETLLYLPENLGLSMPLSKGMLKVAARLLARKEEARLKVWTVSTVAESDERKLLWWSVPKLVSEGKIGYSDFLQKTESKLH